MEPKFLFMGVLSIVLLITALMYIADQGRRTLATRDANKAVEDAGNTGVVANAIETVANVIADTLYELVPLTMSDMNATLFTIFGTLQTSPVKISEKKVAIKGFIQALRAKMEEVTLYRVSEEGMGYYTTYMIVKWKSGEEKLTGVLTFKDCFDYDEVGRRIVVPIDPATTLKPWFDNGKIPVSDSVSITVANDGCDEDCRVDLQMLAREEVKAFLVESKFVKTTEGAESIMRLSMDALGSPSFTPVQIATPATADDILAASYSPVDIRIAGRQFKVPMNELSPMLVEELSKGKNALVLGPTGTGKTRLAQQIIRDVRAADATAHIVTMDLQEVATLMSSKCTDFWERFKALALSENKKIIIHVDEGQSLSAKTDTTALLNLLDGVTSGGQGKIGAIVSFNSKKEDLDEALLRKGRADYIIELDKLNKSEIRALAKAIANNNPLLVADQSLLNSMTEATLAEVWDAFKTKEESTVWAQKFNVYRVAATAAVAPAAPAEEEDFAGESA